MKGHRNGRGKMGTGLLTHSPTSLLVASELSPLLFPFKASLMWISPVFLCMPALEVGIRSLLQGLPDLLRSPDNKFSKLVVFHTPFQTLSQPWLLPASLSGMAFYAFSTWTTSAQLINTLLPLSQGPRLPFSWKPSIISSFSCLLLQVLCSPIRAFATLCHYTVLGVCGSVSLTRPRLLEAWHNYVLFLVVSPVLCKIYHLVGAE